MSFEDNMDKVRAVFLAIKEMPENYLPVKSIWALRDFLSGYSARMLMEGQNSEMRLLYRAFQVWLGKHLDLLVQSQSVYDVIFSYSRGAEDALTNFYRLFEQFQRDYESMSRSQEGSYAGENTVRPQKMDMCEMLRLIRKRPELYIVYPNLWGVNAYLTGHERAGEDLNLPKTPDESLFHDFAKWVSNEKFPAGKPRPWFMLIRFHSAHDCGLAPGSAYSLFFKLLDEFANKIGQPSLFAA